MNAYLKVRDAACWRELPDGEARLFLECVQRAFAINGVEASAFRMMRRDLSYRISPSRFGRLKRSLLTRGLISRESRSDGGKLRDYFKLGLDALNGRN